MSYKVYAEPVELHLHQGDLPDSFSGPVVAIDTETMGLNPHRDRLCLVQLSLGDGHCHLVQIKKGNTAPNLKKLLEDPDILKIFHYARFDVAILKAHLNAQTAPVYCTKIASKLVRTYTDRHGLKQVTQECAGVDISKQQQSSDWGQADLSKAQLNYAAKDVLYLHKIREELDKRLKREGREELAQRCFEFLSVRAELDLLGWENQDIFSHS